MSISAAIHPEREFARTPPPAPALPGRKTRILAGITVMDTPLISRALDYARRVSEPVLYNHAVRSWLFAVRLGQLQRIVHDPEVVALGALLHDIGLTDGFPAGHRRFEVEGADAAREFAQRQGLDDRRVQLVWDTVAMNSTPSLALYKEAEVALGTAGIALDFGGLQYAQIPADEMQGILAEFPRLGMKQSFADCICRVIKTRPETTYDNFARDFGERFVRGYKAPSTVDFLMNAPFDG